MKAEREENLLSLRALKSGSKLGLGERERVSKMKTAVHIRVWKGYHKLFLALLTSISLKHTGSLPFCLYSLFNFTKSVFLISLKKD